MPEKMGYKANYMGDMSKKDKHKMRMRVGKAMMKKYSKKRKKKRKY